MNILFLNEYANPHFVSGAEQSTEALAEALSKKNKVFILSPNLGSQPKSETVKHLKFPFLKKIKPGKILTPLWFNNPLFWLYSAYYICKKVKEKNIKVIHVHGKYILPAAVIAGRLTKIQVVVTVRDFNFLCPLALCYTNQQKKCSFSYFIFKEIPEYLSRYTKPSIFKPFLIIRLIISKPWQHVLKSFVKQSDKVIAISPQLKKICQDAGIKNPIAIYNLPPKKFPSQTPKYKLKGKKIIVSVGKLSYGKGTDTLLQAMKLINKKMPQTLLLIAGSKNISLKAKFPSNTRYLGKLKHQDVFSLYRSADLFIILSRWPEPLGRATLEALTVGLPIIVSNRGGGRNFVKNNGYLVNPDNPRQVADAIVKVLTQPDLNLLRQNSLKLLHTRFNRSKIINKHIELYKSLL